MEQFVSLPVTETRLRGILWAGEWHYEDEGVLTFQKGPLTIDIKDFSGGGEASVFFGIFWSLYHYSIEYGLVIL
mgnify:CR=1 FL=1